MLLQCTSTKRQLGMDATSTHLGQSCQTDRFFGKSQFFRLPSFFLCVSFCCAKKKRMKPFFRISIQSQLDESLFADSAIFYIYQTIPYGPFLLSPKKTNSKAPSAAAVKHQRKNLGVWSLLYAAGHTCSMGIDIEGQEYPPLQTTPTLA